MSGFLVVSGWVLVIAAVIVAVVGVVTGQWLIVAAMAVCALSVGIPLMEL